MTVVGPGIQFDFVVGKVFGANLVKDTRDSVWTCGRIWIEFPNCLRILGGIKPDVVQKIWLDFQRINDPLKEFVYLRDLNLISLKFAG